MSDVVAKKDSGNGKKRKRRLRRKAQSSLQRGVFYPFLCFDTETTNHGELLELAIYDPEGNVVFHEYFRPHASKWPTNIHHITPEMVAGSKRFIAYRQEVQRILNSTNHLVGCALSNDLGTLKRYGVKFHGHHVVHDIQSWFWLLNDDSERRLRKQTGLASIAEHYGLSFGGEMPHSATADTNLTLRCFKALVNDFYSRSLSVPCPEFDVNSIGRITEDYLKAFDVAMDWYGLRNAGGYVNVVARERGFSFRFSHSLPADESKYVFSVPVNDRQGAERDLKHRFESKMLRGFTGIYDLDAEDLRFVREFSNEIDFDTFVARKKRR